MGIGVGVGIWRGGRGGDLPLKLFGAQAFCILRPYKTSRQVLTYLDGPGERSTNGGFESGTAGWSGYSGGSLSSVAGIRTGGAGTLALRVTAALGDAAAGAAQFSLTVGARYLLIVWGKGDGVNGSPKLRDGGVATLALGTSSASWQELAVIFTAQTTELRLETSGNAATEDFVDWDDVSLIELPAIDCLNDEPYRTMMLADPVVADACDAVAAAYASSPHWYAAENAVAFGGVSMYWTINALAAKYTGSDKPWSYIAARKYRTRTANDYEFAISSSASANSYKRITDQGAGGTLNVKHGDDAATTKTLAGTDDQSTAYHVYAVHCDGTLGNTWVDGVAEVVDADLNVGASTLDRVTIGAGIFGGAYTGFADLLLKEAHIVGNAVKARVPDDAAALKTLHGI